MEVPHINEETGISADYWNEYFAKRISFGDGDLAGVSKLFRIFPIQKYEERFPLSIYPNVITERNNARVKRLDQLAELSRIKFIDTSLFKEDDFERLINEVFYLIWNRKDGESAYPNVAGYL